MIGPGKYDDLCTHARETAEAEGALLFIADGKHGNGFSVQGPLKLHVALPNILEALAVVIRFRADWETAGLTEDSITGFQTESLAMLTLGQAAGFLQRDDLRQSIVEMLKADALKRRYITTMRDRCNEILAASEG